MDEIVHFHFVFMICENPHLVKGKSVNGIIEICSLFFD